MQAQLIALDWGTTSLRAYALGEDGVVLGERTLERGIMQLPSGPEGFDHVLEEACGDWLNRANVPIIACGMVGSAQGWREVPYCATPARVEHVSAGMLTVRSRGGRDVHLVPGVMQHSRLPNVMRGEETQVFGLLQDLPNEVAAQPLLIGLPGSHSKWVQVEGGSIQSFDTFMTGELYAAVCKHTILGRTQQPSEQFQQDAFDRAVGVVQSREGRLGLLSNLFSARTLGLTGQLTAEQQPDYVSGLMIGHELAALADSLRAGQPAAALPEIFLIGTDPLCERYRRALQQLGFAQVSLARRATERGLWSLALAARFVTPSTQEV